VTAGSGASETGPMALYKSAFIGKRTSPCCKQARPIARVLPLRRPCVAPASPLRRHCVATARRY